MSGLGDAASKIGEKVVEILDIFDLSFFISGAVVMGALLQFFGPLEKALDELEGAGVFGLVLGSYVLGLVCFAVGRQVRTWTTPKRDQRDHVLIHAAMQAQGLCEGEPAKALKLRFGHDVADGDPEKRKALYTRMWAHVRSYPALQHSFALLNRYWVLSASYDGLGVAALMWLLPVWKPAYQQPSQGSVLAAALWSVAIVVTLLFCWHRAREYKRYQIEELVATVAHWLSLVGRRELDGTAPSLSSSAASHDEAGIEGSSAGGAEGGP